MQKNTKLRFGVVAAAAAVALAFSAAIPASADPVGGSFRPLVGVGSDTTEFLMNGIAQAYSSGSVVASYNATDGNPNSYRSAIQTRSGGPSFLRPNGSGDGQIALSRMASNLTYPAANVVSNGVTFAPTDISGQIDFARSSSAPNGTTGTDLTFIPFAQEDITYAVNGGSDFPRSIAWGNAPGTPTTAFTLVNIYKCNVTTYRDSNFASVTINPLIPQPNSGTRNFWIGSAGMNLGATLGSCVKDTKTTGPKQGTVQEHDGTYLTGAGDIAPFSVAQYIAQANWQSQNTTVIERRGSIALGTIDTIKPLTLAAGGGAQANADFPISRLLFNVVLTSRLNTPDSNTQDKLLRDTFVGSNSGVCQQTTQIANYGAAPIGTLCGDTTTYKQSLKTS